MLNYQSDEFKNKTLKISEIFYSIQGEGSYAGMPCVFVRLKGCNLNCEWCDTKYAVVDDDNFELMTFDDIIEKTGEYNCRLIEFTGGEPLVQKNVLQLMEYFCDSGFTVALETNGSVRLDKVDPRVVNIMDVKCPSSKMSDRNNYANLDILTVKDNIKFVIASREDYEFAKTACEKYKLFDKSTPIFFSGVFGRIDLKALAELILADALPVKMQLQMHKFIWGADEKGV